MSKIKPSLEELQSVFSLNIRVFITKRIAEYTGKDETTLTDADLIEGFKAARVACSAPSYHQQAGPLLRAAIKAHYAAKPTDVKNLAPLPQE